MMAACHIFSHVVVLAVRVAVLFVPPYPNPCPLTIGGRVESAEASERTGTRGKRGLAPECQ